MELSVPASPQRASAKQLTNNFFENTQEIQLQKDTVINNQAISDPEQKSIVKEKEDQLISSKKIKGVQVYVRIRPQNVGVDKNNGQIIKQSITQIDENKKKLSLLQSNEDYSMRNFTFSKIFNDNTSQEQIFNETAEPLLDKVFDGYNCALLVYGQSGSGKTHTMLGEGFDNVQNMKNADKIQQGMVPRFLDRMFTRIYQEPETNVQYDIRASYLEIYQEKIRDLLHTEAKNLSIYSEPNSGLMISNAIQEPIKNSQEVLNLIERGSKLRKMAKTNYNEHSSRSHAIVVVTIFIDNLKTGIKKAAQLYMVDLAGSENVGKAGGYKANEEGNYQLAVQYTDEQIKEAGKINQSLLTLGNVIQAIIDKKKYIPYRDSKLTRLLQNSFGGNSYTSLILTCSQDPKNYFQTLQTLQFGDRANKVANNPMSNSEFGQKELRRMYEQACQKLIEKTQMLKKQDKELQMQKNIMKEMYQQMDPFSQQRFLLKYPMELNHTRSRQQMLKNPQGILKLQGNAFAHVFTFLHPMDIVPLFVVCREFCQRLKSEYLWKVQLDFLIKNNVEFSYDASINSYYVFFSKVSKQNYIIQKQQSIQSQKSGNLQLFKSGNNVAKQNKGVI